LLKETRDEKREKLLQYGKRVWGNEVGSDIERIDNAISRTEAFFQSLGVKTRLSDYGITRDQLTPIVNRLEARGWKLGENRSIGSDRVARILYASL
jgi:NADP-dependent alcohol dehydrogenase